MQKELNPQQKLAAEAPYGPLIIVAGAGTGKTRTLTNRLLHLIKHGVPPEKICAITFTNKAAHEMESRIRDAKLQMHSNAAKGSFGAFAWNSHFSNRDWPFVGTFHSLGAKILRKEAYLLGRKQNFVIFDSDDSFSLIKKIVKKFFPKKRGEEKNRSKYESPVFFAKKISEIKNLSRDSKNPNTSEFREGNPNSKHSNVFVVSNREHEGVITKVFNVYEEALRENNAFDFDDLIEKPVALFQEYPNVLKKHQNKFDAILVDEYQDLNPKQYELIQLLAGGHKNLSVVGDDEQMIYGWRHADIKIFLGFERDWLGAQVAFLEENYRSTGNIVRAAQAVAENNQYRRPKNLWTKNPEGAPIRIVEAEDEEQEAEWIANEIANSIEQIANSKTENDETGHLPFAMSHQPSTAVLYRTNAQSRAIEQALIRSQIPYKIFGGVRFYERKEIKDIVAALRLVWNPKDTISRERLEKNLTRAAFRELVEAIESLRESPEAEQVRYGVNSATATIPRDSFAEFTLSVAEGFGMTNGGRPSTHHVRSGNNTPIALIKLFLEKTDYFDYLERNFTNADERRENIAELTRFAENFEDLGQFLEEVALVQPLDTANSKWLIADSQKANSPGHMPSATSHMPFAISHLPFVVHLMTVHLSKGLEFDRVFVAGCSEGLLPHAMSLENDYQLEEERRLMYVAMTRARRELCVSFYNIPSRFVNEIPEGFIEYKNAAGIAAHQEDEFIILD